MKIVSSSRRQLVMAVLLSLATVGAAMRYWAPNPSVLRDVGTLLLVLWLPAVGNLVAYMIGRLPRRATRATDFEAGSPFIPHLLADLAPLTDAITQSIAPSERRCTLIVGSRGFTARLAIPLQQLLANPAAQPVELELLRPALALRALPAGTPFQLAAGSAVIGTGRITGLSPSSTPPAGSRSAPA